MSDSAGLANPTVLLLHECGDGTHVDWLIAQDPRGRDPLVGFRVERRVDELAGGHRLDATRMADHRSAYLAYEGPISGDRGVSGEYSLHGLTPGASYTVHVDQILRGGFSTKPIAVSSSEEFYNGANESNDPRSDEPSDAVAVGVVAGSPATGVDVILNAL